MSIPDPNLYPIIIITTIFSRILQLYYEPKNNEKKMKKKKNRLTKNRREKHDIHITWQNGGSQN